MIVGNGITILIAFKLELSSKTELHIIPLIKQNSIIEYSYFILHMPTLQNHNPPQKKVQKRKEKR